MLLDAGICIIYRVTAPRAADSPVSGAAQVYRNWYGILGHEAGGGDEGDMTRRIRVHAGDIRDYDIALLDAALWRVTRVYHGRDDESGQLICDVTLAGGPRHFLLAELIPRATSTDPMHTLLSTPDEANVRHVWISTANVTAEEHYSAEAVGHELSLSAQVYAVEYRGEPYLRLDGALYEVRRREQRGPITTLILEVRTPWPE